jgi:hypothetical protein
LDLSCLEYNKLKLASNLKIKGDAVPITKYVLSGNKSVSLIEFELK